MYLGRLRQQSSPRLASPRADHPKGAAATSSTDYSNEFANRGAYGGLVIYSTSLPVCTFHRGSRSAGSATAPATGASVCPGAGKHVVQGVELWVGPEGVKLSPTPKRRAPITAHIDSALREDSLSPTPCPRPLGGRMAGATCCS